MVSLELLRRSSRLSGPDDAWLRTLFISGRLKPGTFFRLLNEGGLGGGLGFAAGLGFVPGFTGGLGGVFIPEGALDTERSLLSAGCSVTGGGEADIRASRGSEDVLAFLSFINVNFGGDSLNVLFALGT